MATWDPRGRARGVRRRALLSAYYSCSKIVPFLYCWAPRCVCAAAPAFPPAMLLGAVARAPSDGGAGEAGERTSHRCVK